MKRSLYAPMFSGSIACTIGFALLATSCEPGTLGPTAGDYGVKLGSSSDCIRIDVSQMALSSSLSIDLYVETDEHDAYEVRPIVTWPGAFAFYQSEEDILTFQATPTDSAEDWSIGATSPISIFDGAYHHLAVIWNGKRGTIFVDGEIVAYANMDLSGSPDRTLSIGCWDEVDESFPGVIGEVRLVDGIAWEDDFEPLWTPWAVTDSVVGLWHLDEGRGESVLDETGDFDGVLEHGEWAAFSWSEDSEK